MDAIKRLFSILSVLSLAGVIAFYKVLDDSPLEQNKRTLVIATSQRNDEINELKDNVNKLLRAVVAMADTDNNTNLSAAADQILKEIKGDFSSQKLSSGGGKEVVRKYESEDLTISRNENRLEEGPDVVFSPKGQKTVAEIPIQPEVDMKPDATHSKDISANGEPEEETKVNQNEAGKAKDTIQAENIDKVDTTTDEIKQDTRSGPGSMEDEVEDDDEDESRAEDEDTTIEGFARDFNSSAALIEVSLNATSGNYSFSLDLAQNTSHPDEPAKKVNTWIPPEHFYDKSYHKEKISVYPHHAIIQNTSLCSNDTEIITLINTRVDAFDKRDAIRRTWGSAMRSQRWFNHTLPTKFAIGFVIGLSRNDNTNNRTRLEHQQNQDMIIGDFYDAYNNLTRKSLLAMRWAFTHCPQARYFLKSDDDMFLNVPGILNALDKEPLVRAMMGAMYKGAHRVARKGKWAVPREIHPRKNYPWYLTGSSYILSMDIVKDLFNAAEYFPHNTVDDAFITGVLAYYVGHIRMVDPGGFSFNSFKKTPFPSVCDFVTNRRLTGHKYKPDQMLDIWEQLRKFNSTMC